jgi:hypothetical protein
VDYSAEKGSSTPPPEGGGKQYKVAGRLVKLERADFPTRRRLPLV